jgi:hypothetical protein
MNDMVTYVNSETGNEAVLDMHDAETIAHYVSMGYAVKGEKAEAEAPPAKPTGGAI